MTRTISNEANRFDARVKAGLHRAHVERSRAFHAFLFSLRPARRSIG